MPAKSGGRGMPSNSSFNAPWQASNAARPVEFSRPLFHETTQATVHPLGSETNEACPLRREGRGKARSDRQGRPVARPVGANQGSERRGLFAGVAEETGRS